MTTTLTAQGEAGDAVPKRPRSAFLDNAKAQLIAIVVFTHLFELVLRYHEPGTSFYRTILLFHMPAFVFVSGRLSRPDAYTRQGARSVWLLAWTYLLVNGLNHLWTVAVTGGQFSLVHVIVWPYFALWFLLALFWWRLLLPAFAWGDSKWHAVGSIAAAALLAALSGYALPRGEWLALSRTFVFLPFFVAGWRSGQQGWTLPRAWWTRALAVIAFVAAFAVLLWGNPIEVPELLFGRLGYAEMGITSPTAWVRRLVLLAASGVLIAAFLQLVPRRRVAYTLFGATTLSIYVWHAFALRLIRYYDQRELFGGTPGAVVLWTGVAVIAFGAGIFAKVTLFVTSGKRI